MRKKARRKYENRMKRLHGDGYVVGEPKNRKNASKKAMPPEERRIRHNARRMARRALASGKILKQPCFVCGEEQVEIHHPDYSHPLSVTWLCNKHHTQIHKEC